MKSTNGSEKSHSLQSKTLFQKGQWVREALVPSEHFDSTSTSVFKDSAWNWLIFKALHRGFQTPRTFKLWTKFWLIFKDFQRPCKKGAFKLWLIFKDFQRPCKKGAFKLQGPSSAEPSSDLFLRTFKGLAKKGLWNSNAFPISFKHFRRLSRPCHVRTALPTPESTQAKINLMRLNTENFTISVNTQHDPIHLSTLRSSHPQSTVPH